MLHCWLFKQYWLQLNSQPAYSITRDDCSDKSVQTITAITLRVITAMSYYIQDRVNVIYTVNHKKNVTFYFWL